MIESKKYKIKKDRYTKVRGGTSKLLIIKCNKCDCSILLYQKDGPGKLLRMYLDKIIVSIKAHFLTTIRCRSDMKKLICLNCNELLAIPMVYKSENRLAYRVIRGKIKITESKTGYFPHQTDLSLKKYV